MNLEEEIDAYTKAKSYERKARDKEKNGDYKTAIELWKRYAEVKEKKGKERAWRVG